MTNAPHAHFGNGSRRSATVLAIVFLFVLTSCATTPISRLNATDVPSGSLRLAQVMGIFPRSQILPPSDIYETLLASGLKDPELRDGSIAIGRVICCGGPEQLQRQESILFYVPSDVGELELNDLVEIRSGAEQPGKATKTGAINTVTRIRQKHSDAFNRLLVDGPCRWDPPKPNLDLWTRVLYCDWMKEEGWVKQNDYWFKPASSQ